MYWAAKSWPYHCFYESLCPHSVRYNCFYTTAYAMLLKGIGIEAVWEKINSFMCSLDWSFKTSWLSIWVLFSDICFPLPLLSTNQMKWMWCSESVQNQKLAVLHWAAQFSSCLCQQSRRCWASWESQMSTEYTSHGRIYCGYSALAGATVSSTVCYIVNVHSIAPLPSQPGSMYSMQHTVNV